MKLTTRAGRIIGASDDCNPSVDEEEEIRKLNDSREGRLYN